MSLSEAIDRLHQKDIGMTPMPSKSVANQLCKAAATVCRQVCKVVAIDMHASVNLAQILQSIYTGATRSAEFSSHMQATMYVHTGLVRLKLATHPRQIPVELSKLAPICAASLACCCSWEGARC